MSVWDESRKWQDCYLLNQSLPPITYLVINVCSIILCETVGVLEYKNDLKKFWPHFCTFYRALVQVVHKFSTLMVALILEFLCNLFIQYINIISFLVPSLSGYIFLKKGCWIYEASKELIIVVVYQPKPRHWKKKVLIANFLLAKPVGIA